MKISNHINNGRQRIGWPGYARERWQWQPDLDSHDPNPPITIDNPAGGSTIIEADGASSGVATVTGIGAAIFAGVGSSDGIAVAEAVAASVVVAEGSASGVAAADAISGTVYGGVGDAQGTSTAQADAAAVAAGDAAAEGSASAQADAASILVAEGLSEGVAEALAEGEDAQVAGPTVDWQQGGAGYPVKKRRKRIDQTVAEWVDEIYSEITAPEAPKDVRLEAARLAKPLSRTPSAKVPDAETVDWQAFAAEATKVRALLALWEREALRRALEDDEEDAIAMGML